MSGTFEVKREAGTQSQGDEAGRQRGATAAALKYLKATPKRHVVLDLRRIELQDLATGRVVLLGDFLWTKPAASLLADKLFYLRIRVLHAPIQSWQCRGGDSEPISDDPS